PEIAVGIGEVAEVTSAHALELRVVGLAGERAAPRVGARDAELRERPERVRVDPRLPERARLGHALLVGLLVGGEAALLEVEEHALRHDLPPTERARARQPPWLPCTGSAALLRPDRAHRSRPLPVPPRPAARPRPPLPGPPGPRL